MYRDSSRVAGNLNGGLWAQKFVWNGFTFLAIFISILGVFAGKWLLIIVLIPIWACCFGCLFLFQRLLGKMVVIDSVRTGDNLLLRCLSADHTFSTTVEAHILQGVHNFIIVVKDSTKTILFVPRRIRYPENVDRVEIESATGLKVDGTTLWDFLLRLL